ncbi:hypothetical protein DEJ46_03940 [Streptomyces venezuelae]|uniref:Uncharacterized protein n=1 Tax=Streptomyces venezuelae TaxID=54571 RepID=A0A5P2AN96_STRVZ|nr:hypothetical protein DEJ46_03940 [Streptomyces venezuelae]
MQGQPTWFAAVSASVARSLIALYFRGSTASGLSGRRGYGGVMELRDVEVFLVLAEELHFGRSAERLLAGRPRCRRQAPRRLTTQISRTKQQEERIP